MFNTFETHTERAKVLQDLRARTVSPIFYGKFPDVVCLLFKIYLLLRFYLLFILITFLSGEMCLVVDGRIV